MFQCWLGLPRAIVLLMKVTFVVINWQQISILSVPLQRNGDKPFPHIPAQTVSSPYQSVQAAALLPQVSWQGAKPRRTSHFLNQPSLDFNRSRDSLLIQCNKRKTLMRVWPQGQNSLPALSWGQHRYVLLCSSSLGEVKRAFTIQQGISNLWVGFLFVLFFAVVQSYQRLWIHEWITSMFFHLIYSYFPNSLEKFSLERVCNSTCLFCMCF